MKRLSMILSLALTLTLTIPALPTAAAEDVNANVKSSTVFIASYDYSGNLLARGSGFFVDEGIVITNIHVIAGAGRYYRIFLADKNDELDPLCYKDIGRSDVKMNLEDDVAYLRVYINCPHEYVYFSDEDPAIGSSIGIYGFPALGDNFFSSFKLIYTPGKVLEETRTSLQGALAGPWMLTDGKIHAGNSGGPVVQNGQVVGIAVAARLNEKGETLNGIFIPVSQVRRGLEYANDSSFGYKVQPKKVEEGGKKKPLSVDDPFNPPPSNRINVTLADCNASLGGDAEATGFSKEQGDACRCVGGYHREGTQCLPGSPKAAVKTDLRKKSTQQQSVKPVSVKTKKDPPEKKPVVTAKKKIAPVSCTFDRRNRCKCPSGYKKKADMCVKVLKSVKKAK